MEERGIRMNFSPIHSAEAAAKTPHPSICIRKHTLGLQCKQVSRLGIILCAHLPAFAVVSSCARPLHGYWDSPEISSDSPTDDNRSSSAARSRADTPTIHLSVSLYYPKALSSTFFYDSLCLRRFAILPLTFLFPSSIMMAMKPGRKHYL